MSDGRHRSAIFVYQHRQENMAKVTGSHLFIKALQAEGVDTVFGIAGDHILHMLDVMVYEPFRMVSSNSLPDSLAIFQ